MCSRPSGNQPSNDSGTMEDDLKPPKTRLATTITALVLCAALVGSGVMAGVALLVN